jgi:hypothetical protein
MDITLVNFLLQNLGVPIIAAIIKQHQANNNNSLAGLTSESVITTWLSDPKKWEDQGNAWLAANPPTK